MTERGKKAAYTLELRLEAVRLVKGGRAKSVTAKILGVQEPTLGNWVRLAAQGKLVGAGGKPVSAEQMELARLRAELARVKLDRGTIEESRIMDRLRTTEYSGKVSHPLC